MFLKAIMLMTTGQLMRIVKKVSRRIARMVAYALPVMGKCSHHGQIVLRRSGGFQRVQSIL